MPADRSRQRGSTGRTLAATIGWDAKIAAVVGDKAGKIEKAFGYRTVGELLQHYPRSWVPKGKLSDIDPSRLDEHVTVAGRIARARLHEYRDKRTRRLAHRLELDVAIEGNHLLLTFFDRADHTARWRADRLTPGTYGMFSGKLGRFRDRLQLVNPVVEPLEGADGDEPDGEAVFASAFETWPALLPIYPATSTLTSQAIWRAIRTALDLVHEVPELLPEEVRREHDFLSAREALRRLHAPESWAQLTTAKARLAFDEAFVTQTVLAQRRAQLLAMDARPRAGRPGGLLDRFDERLPFELTAGQRDIGRVVADDLAGGHPMHRLLQGEVGSGKTVVALRAVLQVVDSGGQAALLAPTEVLAQQHHRSITAMLGDLGRGGMLDGDPDGTRVALLTGSSGAAARREAMLDAASGAAGLVIGTHALLEDKVQFADLGLVVVDEQHRFGVEQRAALSSKSGGTPPHVLVMTATPIPRTVAMTVFGDLETSTLTELPAGRAPIQTSVIPVATHPAWVLRAYDRIREEVGKGHQAYVVTPRIDGEEPEEEPEEEPDGRPARAPAAAVTEVAPMLAEGPMAGLRVAVLHGRLAPDEKDRAMREFAAGRIDVLVSTTVIEVGVDVPNATVMLVLDADRFGISQLHQLRGRIGRGGLPGLCLLTTGAPPDSPARARLEAVAATTDGFALSRLDLQQRREGDVLGASQSGHRSSLRLLDVLEDEEVIGQAREIAVQVVAEDPGLSGHPLLAEQVRRLHDAAQADYLEKA